jgi:hypothetical protein
MELHVGDNHLSQVARPFDLQLAPAWGINGAHAPFGSRLGPIHNADSSLAAMAL